MPAIDTEPLRLLAVEDDPADSAWLVQLLEQSSVCPYHLSFVLTMADAEVSLGVGEVDCVLLDLSLPDSWGLESIRRILSVAPTTPVVVITGANDQEQGLAAIEMGAHDYLEKGKVSGDGVLRAARWATARARVIGERASGATGGPALSGLRTPWATLGRDLVITDAGAALVAAMSGAETEVVGVPFATLVHRDDADAVLAVLRSVAGGGRTSAVVRAALAGPAGTDRWLLAVVAADSGLVVLAVDPS